MCAWLQALYDFEKNVSFTSIASREWCFGALRFPPVLFHATPHTLAKWGCQSADSKFWLNLLYLYCLDYDRRVVIPIEFTVADDANLGTAVRRKHAKYDPWLLRNPSASVARLVPGARDPHTWTFDPLVVIEIGVWGTMPHSTIVALTALGLSVAAANAALGAVLESVAHCNMLISRLRHSSPTRWCGIRSVP